MKTSDLTMLALCGLAGIGIAALFMRSNSAPVTININAKSGYTESGGYGDDDDDDEWQAGSGVPPENYDLGKLKDK